MVSNGIINTSELNEDPRLTISASEASTVSRIHGGHARRGDGDSDDDL